MVIGGSLFYGVSFAMRMYKRRENLKALEKILIYLESEIRYRHSIISEAFFNAAKKSDEPFNAWLLYLGKKLNEDDGAGFWEIWTDSLNMLSSGTCLSKEDIEEISQIGQTLGYLDIEAHKMGLRLEIDNFHEKISDYNADLKDKMRVSVISGAVIGILVVIVLL
ncbi:MAG: stage III sporulation protein AB [Lachnospiraceae bacterium]|nr:stage III sporulation protein AB [Lachnospiraceae bacterium]